MHGHGPVTDVTGADSVPCSALACPARVFWSCQVCQLLAVLLLGGEKSSWTLPRGTELRCFLFAPPPVFGIEPLGFTGQVYIVNVTLAPSLSHTRPLVSQACAANQQLLSHPELPVSPGGAFCRGEGQGGHAGSSAWTTKPKVLNPR